MTPCARCATAIEAGDLRCAICAFPVQAAGPDGDGVRHAQVLRCGDCGAAVAFSAEARAPRCGFCGATMAIEQPIDPIEAARLWLPFTVDRAAAEAALRGWLAERGWFAPPALSSEAVLEALTPLAWAAWRVNADAFVTWTADSDAGARRSAWAPHAGETSLAFRDIVISASRGLGEAETRRLLPYYDLSRAVPVDPPVDPPVGPPVGTDEARAVDGVDGGVVIERFDAQRSAARSCIQRRIDAAARVRVEPRIPGRRFRNVHAACLIERQTTERLALPAWILAYRHRGKPYRAIVHGQRAEVVIGRAPLDGTKVRGLIALVALVALVIAMLVMRR